MGRTAIFRRMAVRPRRRRWYGQTAAPPTDPQFGDVGNHLQGTASTMNVDVPDNVAVDDIVIVFAMVDVAATTITALASGFAEAPDSPVLVNPGGGGQSHNLHILWKRATAADSTAGTYDFTLSASVYRYARAARYWNCLTSGSPWDVTASAVDVTNGTATPAVSDTTTGDNEKVVWASTNWAAGAAPSWTPPAGYTERSDIGDSVLTFADLTQTTAGATGSISGSNTGSGARTAWIGALKPAGASDSRAQTGRSAVGVASQATQVKRAPVAASGVAATAASGTVFHAAAVAKTGSSSTALASRATAVKVSTQTTRAGVGVLATGTAVKVSAQSARSTLGTATRATQVKKAVTVGSGTLAAAAAATDRKLTAQSGLATTGALAFGTVSTGTARAQTGRACVACAARAAGAKVAPAAARGTVAATGLATAIKTARPTGTATLGTATRGAMTKRATPTATCPVGTGARAALLRRAQPGGTAAVAVGPSASSPSKRTGTTGTCVVILLAARIETSRPALGRCYVALSSWNRPSRVTRRPFLTATVRPGSGTIPRPYAGTTARP